MSRSILFGCAVLLAGGCGQQVHLGDIGDGAANILWTATFEVGDLSEWVGDGHGGEYADNAPVVPSTTTDVTHRGRYAGMVTVTPTAVTTAPTTSINYLFRNQPRVPDAYYSAWFYIPATFTVRTWLSLSHFRCSGSGDGNNLSPIWDVNLYPRLDGSLIAHLYNYSTQKNVEQAFPVPVPIATWVHFEVFLRKSAKATGEVAVYQNGALILDNPNVVTAATDWVEWDAGGASDNVAPQTAVIYVDDAAISLTRLGTSDWSAR
jgi:hypothetical protein